MLKYVVMVCSLVCLLSSTPAFAAKALVGNFITDGLGGMRVVVKNETCFRIDLVEDGASEDVFLLMVDGKRWMVGRDSSESNWEAIDFEAMVTYMFETDTLGSTAAEKAIITKIGKQTVGDVAGETFKAQYGDETYELTLTKNADIVTLTKAIFMFLNGIDEDEINTMIAIVTQISDTDKKAYGLLQYGDDFVFKGLERQNYPDSYFTLPSNVNFLDLDDF